MCVAINMYRNFNPLEGYTLHSRHFINPNKIKYRLTLANDVTWTIFIISTYHLHDIYIAKHFFKEDVFSRFLWKVLEYISLEQKCYWFGFYIIFRYVCNISHSHAPCIMMPVYLMIYITVHARSSWFDKQLFDGLM